MSNVAVKCKWVNSFVLEINGLVLWQTSIELKCLKRRYLQEQHQFCVFEEFKVALRLIFCENYLTVKSSIPAIVLYFPLTPQPLSHPHPHPLSVPQKKEEKKVRKKERKKEWKKDSKQEKTRPAENLSKKHFSKILSNILITGLSGYCVPIFFLFYERSLWNINTYVVEELFFKSSRLPKSSGQHMLLR